jgi:2-polyprenyl-6-methoxyphenol hydroxylase-like FAD-dependent oxidoreductase
MVSSFPPLIKMVLVLPHRAAGAMSAIEDAEALSVFLRHVTPGSPTSVHNALLQAYRVRYKRASMCQLASRAEGINSEQKPDSGEEILRIWTYPGAERWAAERPDMVLDA